MPHCIYISPVELLHPRLLSGNPWITTFHDILWLFCGHQFPTGDGCFPAVPPVPHSNNITSELFPQCMVIYFHFYALYNKNLRLGMSQT